MTKGPFCDILVCLLVLTIGMKIAMIGQKGIPALHGGIERHVHELSLALTARGFDVLAYGRKWYTNREDGMFEGIELVHVRTLHTKHLDAILSTFFATIDAIRRRVDVIHYHGVGPSLLSWIPRIFAPHILVVSTFHSIDRKHQKWGPFARFTLRLGEWAACHFSHRSIAVSRTIYQYMRDVYDTESFYIPNAVPAYEPILDESVMAEWNLLPKEYVLVVSRLIPHKGIHYIVDAWKQLLQKNPAAIGNKKLVIVGDGYYTDEYVDFVKSRAANIPSIVFTGFKSGSTLHTLYSQASFMIHPSDNEGLPICVLEGMSYRLPLLLSDIVEHKDLIENKNFFFQRGDISSLVEKLEFVFSQSKEALVLEGQKNRAVIEREFEWGKVIDKIIAVYQTVVVKTKVQSLPVETH